MADELLGPHGGYRNLRAFQLAEVVYDGTDAFAKLYLDKKSRTVDQMIQAARSGRQNIAEGSRASATSKKTELTLTNVARSSLDELLLDYEISSDKDSSSYGAKNIPKRATYGALRPS